MWQKRYSPPGTSPGTLRPPVGMPREVHLTAIHYTPETYREEEVTDLDAFLQGLPAEGVLWLNVDGLWDVSVLERVMFQKWTFSQKCAMMSTFFTRRISWFSFPCCARIVRAIR